MKRYIKSSTNPIEVFNTGGNTWFAEMGLGDGTYTVVSNAYENELAIYTYPESGDEDDKYYEEGLWSEEWVKKAEGKWLTHEEVELILEKN